MPERPKGADCKSAGSRLRRFESFSLHQLREHWEESAAGIAQLVERQPSKLNVTGSNPVSRSTTKENGNTKRFAHIAQSAEHFLGKEEVTSSILVVGSRNRSRGK
jgi:hypothetical protein